jgi:hypothetical protein
MSSRCFCLADDRTRAAWVWLLCKWYTAKIAPVIPPFSYTPATATIKWKDKNNANWSGNLTYFNANADPASVYDIEFGLGSPVTAIQGLGNFPLLNVLSFAPGVNIGQLDIQYNPLITQLGASGSLTSLNIDTILSLLVSFGKLGGSASISGQVPPAPPTVGPPNGIAAKATLIGRGWTVTTD